jgi:gliding motility-associated-like protein
VAVSGSGTGITLNFGSDATAGTLSVFGSNAECGAGPPSNLSILVFPIPLVTLDPFDTACYNAAQFQLTGGKPAGGDFLVNGAVQTTFAPLTAGEGSHSVLYRFSDIHGCQSSDSTQIIVKKGQECEIVIWVPTGFSPNGDGLNDSFKAFSRNIQEFSMNIYDRSGELVFTSTQPDTGWDGTYKGKLCPVGNYIYMIVYQISPAVQKNKTLTGDLVLVR